MKTILIVEDDAMIRKELEILLSMQGYQIKTIDNFIDTSTQILTHQCDLIILDLNLPNESGFQICQNIKNSLSTPILVLTSKTDLNDELKALKLGANEFLTKPFRKERLLARIKNLLKYYEYRCNLIEADGFLLDKNTYTLYFKNNSYVLSKNQGKLLEALLSAKDNYLSKEELSLKLWNTIEYIDENALSVNIMRLKKTLKEISFIYNIVSLRKEGYKLVRDE